MKRVWDDHLSHADVYERLDPTIARARIKRVRATLEALMEANAPSMSPGMRKYFQRARRKRDYRVPCFYILMKIQKFPWKTRPVTDCFGSVTAIYSKWLDYWMGELCKNLPTKLRDSQDLLDRIKTLGHLPHGARLFTADAVSMYTNINTAAAIDAIREWLTRFKAELPDDFPPTELFLSVLQIIMENSIFTFGDTYWRQGNGTAMGTSCACMYAMLFYGLHERCNLLPDTAPTVPLLARFIDDMFGIWIDPTLPPDLTEAEEKRWWSANEKWKAFETSLTFGGLEWTTCPPAKSQVMLDLTLTVEHGDIWSKTFQKALNLYLYLPPSSAHPPSCFKGLIIGEIGRYWRQCSRPDDFVKITALFIKRLRARGHRAANLLPLVREAASHIMRSEEKSPELILAEKANKSEAGKKNLFLHIDYHSHGVSRLELRSLYDRFLRGNLPESFEGMIVATSRPKNIRNACVSNLFECEDPATLVSTAWGPVPEPV